VSDEGTDGEGRRRRGIREGLSQSLGFLSALKDAIEETLAETRDRSGANTEAARDALKEAFSRAQEATEAARERLDFVTRREMDRLREQVRRLALRVERLERGDRAE
jgi:polyhydroxyalkanoate synthesis regulator phasin